MVREQTPWTQSASRTQTHSRKPDGGYAFFRGAPAALKQALLATFPHSVQPLGNQGLEKAGLLVR